MDDDGSTGRGHGADGPFVFDEAWARSGVPESALRRKAAPPPRLPSGANVTGAPAGPRDWTPSEPPSGGASGRRPRRRWVSLLIVFLLAAAVFVGLFAVDHHSSPSGSPIAGGTVLAPPSPSATDTEPRVEGLTPASSVGSCFDLRGPIDIKATFVPCRRRHELQLVGIETATGTSSRFPADSYWNGPVERRCVADLAAYSHQQPRHWPPRLTETEFIPRRPGWATGDRTIYCAGRYHPKARGSLRSLRPYLGRHAPIADRVTSAPTASPTPTIGASSDAADILTGRLGLIQTSAAVCLTVTNSAGTVALQPIGNYSETWQITNGSPDVAQSGIAVGQHPKADDIVRHVGSSVTLTGTYATTRSSCGAGREFDFTAVR